MALRRSHRLTVLEAYGHSNLYCMFRGDSMCSILIKCLGEPDSDQQLGTLLRNQNHGRRSFAECCIGSHESLGIYPLEALDYLSDLQLPQRGNAVEVKSICAGKVLYHRELLKCLLLEISEATRSYGRFWGKYLGSISEAIPVNRRCPERRLSVLRK